jgi:hypothetical protein
LRSLQGVWDSDDAGSSRAVRRVRMAQVVRVILIQMLAIGGRAGRRFPHRPKLGSGSL